MKLLGKLHHHGVFKRRVRVLADVMSPLLSPGWSVLDVGCGDGTLGAALGKAVPGLQVRGIDVMARPACAMPFELFDGRRIPLPDGAVDAVICVDVLHHVPPALLPELFSEMARVAARRVILKDHVWRSRFDFRTLAFMDWVGNAPHGVEVVQNYLRREQWQSLVETTGLEMVEHTETVPLYPPPFSLVFGRDLHFVAAYERAKAVARA